MQSQGEKTYRGNFSQLEQRVDGDEEGSDVGIIPTMGQLLELNSRLEKALFSTISTKP
jgi:hypothetical protein